MTNQCFRCGKKKTIFSRWKDFCPECLELIKREDEERHRQFEEDQQRRVEKAKREKAKRLKEIQRSPEYKNLVKWKYLAPLRDALFALEVLPESEVAEITHGYTDDDRPRYVFTQWTPILSLEEAVAKVKQYSEGAPVMQMKGVGFMSPEMWNPATRPSLWLSLEEVSSRMLNLSKVKEYEGGNLWFPCYVVRTAKGYLVSELWCR
jgi:hypothetical protein